MEVSNKVKIKLPKFLKYKRGLYEVYVYSKKYKKEYFVGSYTTTNEAIIHRDSFIEKNKHDVTLGSLPRGISYHKKNKKYTAYISLLGRKNYLGSFDEMQDAVYFRRNYIDSLK